MSEETLRRRVVASEMDPGQRQRCRDLLMPPPGQHGRYAAEVLKVTNSQAGIQEFITGMRAGDFSRLASAFEGEPALVQLWDEQGAFAGLPEVRAEALTCACFLGKVGVATYFLSHGISPGAGARTGLSALHWAVNRGQLEVVRLLLARGADLEARSMYDGTALGTAVWSSVHEPRPTHRAIIETLLEAGARIEDAGYPSGDDDIDALLRRYGASAA